MFGLGFGELTIALLIFFVLFGAKRLPELGEGLGKGILSFRQSLKQRNEIETEKQTRAYDQEQNRQ